MKKLFRNRKFYIVLGILAVVGLGLTALLSSDVPVTKPNMNEKPLGALELSETFFPNYWGDSLRAERGQLVVPETRDDPQTNHIELFFCRFKSSNPDPGAPIIFLAGGPGSSGISVGQSQYFYLFKELRKYADVILLDQRGTGNSIPNLNCRNNLSLPTDITENIQDALFDDLSTKIGECGQEFRDMGIRLESYNSRESAYDIESLRTALGYDKVTLYGYSYGTSLAQHYVRYFGDKVDRLILAGPIAPDQGLKLPAEVHQQFVKMDSLVARDVRLSKYVPSFTGLMREVHDDLKRAPKEVRVPLRDALDDDAPALQEAVFDVLTTVKPTWNMKLADEHLQMIASEYIGNDRWLARYPEFYYQMKSGNYRDVGNFLRNFRRRRLPNALFFTVNGATSYATTRWELAHSQDGVGVLESFGISFGRYPVVTEAFGVEKQDGLNEPVSGNSKVLFIAGTLDGRTPPSNVDTLARRFPNSHRIMVENAGHNNLLNKEIMNGIIAFVQDSLSNDIRVHREIEFLNPVPYKYSIGDTLVQRINTSGIDDAIALYRSLEREHGETPDYIFDFGESALNTLAYRLMGENQIEEAIAILKLAIEEFPEAYNLRNSIAEAYLLVDDTTNAKANLEKAIELNYFDAYSQAMLADLKRKEKRTE